ncbi:DUF1653 domain-containing protein [Roseburia hominis]|uniref:DUF1653 domain-containing protein n=1 Tax=Roseburia hominis TaxID=301301 RepID=UPI001F3D9413|nr:DUF1653 domain-containing protein [Roseburia hominis]
MQEIPRSGEIYRHFKNKLYQIITVAKHTETNEDMVIYQALYGSFETYARPLSMFLSKVDSQKYPDATQTYRFEKVAHSDLCKPNDVPVVEESDPMPHQKTNSVAQHASAPNVTAPTDVNTASNEEDLSGVNPNLLAILDTDTYEQKYKLLCNMRDDMDDRLINDLSVALDIAVDDGPIERRYEQLKSALATLCKYEVNRLR